MNKKYKILVADDDLDILEIIKFNLERSGFDVIVTNKSTETYEMALKYKPDLILHDIMMPDMDGYQVCRKIKKSEVLKSIPFVFLTARNEEYSEVQGFDVGAEDYIAKPIKPAALSTRLKAIIKRNSKEDEQPNLNIGIFNIDREGYVVYKNGEEIQLPKKEFELLYALASTPGKVFSRDDILNRIWGNEVYVGERTVDVHIRKIREKIGEDYITTIKGVGYKFVAE
jgi:two-component system alkaline phosphatase synthesis response regulator PhoP